MTSLRQIESNRRNAQKSSGPITEEGKQRSRRNALRHGLTAETVIKLIEDPDDYHAFEMSVTADYEPNSAVERELVLRLASLLWRLRRATAIETGLFQVQYEDHLDPNRPPAEAAEQSQVITIFNASTDTPELALRFLRLAELDDGAFERLGRYEAALWRQVRQTIFTLEALRWRAPDARNWRTQNRWQRAARGASDAL